MRSRDFFAFCTSLTLTERQAIGRLSRVQHFARGQTIYRAGDPSGALYIINRGMVELVQEQGSPLDRGTYLSRGDIFGDTEMLTNVPRTHLVRTREAVSLQCFEAKDLAELLREVPSFFRYLCEQFAARLLQASETSLARSHCLELSGSLANFDLVTIFQTIVHSARTGDLSILNEKGTLLGLFRFVAGQPRGGRFQHLVGDEAFWQLFLADEIRGKFSFSSSENEADDEKIGHEITHPAGDLLISALQMRDEFHALRETMPDPSAMLEKLKTQPSLEEIAPKLRATAEHIWKLSLRGGRLRLRSLYPHLPVCEMKVYEAVAELLRTEHFTLSAPARKVA